MENIKYIIRVANTDLNGNTPVYRALRKIKGVNFMFSNAICKSLNLDPNKKAGALTPDEVKQIQDKLENPKEIPSWLYNRRRDYDTGEDIHLSTSKLKLRKEFDIKRLQRIKSNRGLRLSWGLPVRGQRTKAHFRKTGKAVGVIKKSLKPAKKGEGKGGKRDK